jgi:hypothetical protein
MAALLLFCSAMTSRHWNNYFVKYPQHRPVAGLIACLLYIMQSQFVFAEDWRYTVKPGDTIWSVTKENLVNMSYWQRLGQINQINDPYHIPPGTKLRVPVSWISKFPVIARVNNLFGEAELIEANNGKIMPLSRGSYVFMGETVQTKADSSLVLEFVDGSTILLQSESRLQLDHLSIVGKTGMVDTQIHLNRGRVETKVEKRKGSRSRFEIKTPAGVTSVRGTDYRVSAEQGLNQSLTEVLEGHVKVSSAGNTKSISGGYGTVYSANEPPIQPIQLLPPIDQKLIPNLFERLPVQFALPSESNIKGYRFQIAANNLFDKLLFDRKYTSNQVRGPELPDGDYYARIRGIDDHGLEGKNTELLFKINAKPEAPFLQEPKPEDGLIEETPGFLWSRQEGIQKFHFQLARDKKFTDIVFDSAKVAENSLVSGYKLELKQYFWRVACIDDSEGEGPFSSIQTFKRVKPPPQAEEPAINDKTMTLRWPADLPGVKYHFQMAKDESFKDILVDKQLAEPNLEIPRPDGGEYFIRVQTAYPDGFVGPYGKPQIIDVPRSGVYWWLLTLLPLALLAL